MNKPSYLRVVNISGGKDSTALLILMIEKEMPIDVVLWADTGMEFPEMYDHIRKLDDYLYEKRGLRITRVCSPHSFEWFMFDEPKQKPSAIENRKAKGVSLYGNGWPGIRVRWCTGQLKTHLLEKYANSLKKDRQVIHYVAIAADETWRCKDKTYPLVEWGITEAQALQICYDRGFDFGGLYRLYARASCWCCPFQRISALRTMRTHHPELWARLLDMDRRALEQFGETPLGRFKTSYTVTELDARFTREEQNAQIQGESPVKD